LVPAAVYASDWLMLAAQVAVSVDLKVFETSTTKNVMHMQTNTMNKEIIYLTFLEK